MREKLESWIAELRVTFLTGTIVSILLGAIIAWTRESTFHPAYFLLTLAGGTLLHLGANVVNDYFDHKSGNDEINKEFIKPFSGGSRMIQLGLLTPREVLSGAILLYTAAATIGIYLAWTRGAFIIVLALVGILSGFLYTFPPFSLIRLGIGEVIVGMNFGALLTLGSYYVQTQTVTPEPLIASIPISLLIIAVLYVNEFPDSEADRAVGKKTIVVRLGRAKAVYIYSFVVMIAYTFIVLNVLYGLTPLYTLFALIPFPLAVDAIGKISRFHSEYPKLAPTNALTIIFHFLTSLLISCGYLIHGFLTTNVNLGFYVVTVVVLSCTLTTIYFYRKRKSMLL